MEQKEWRMLAVGSILILSLVLLSCIPFMKKAKSRSEKELLVAQDVKTGGEKEQEKRDGQQTAKKAQKKSQDVSEIPDSLDTVKRARETEWSTLEQEEKNYMKLPKKDMEGVEVYLQEHYMASQIIFNIEGDEKMTYDTASIIRAFEGKIFKGSVKKEEPLKKIEIKRGQVEKKNRFRIIFTFREILEPVLYETEKAYYVTLARPKKVYDKIIVLDAGHGGIDEGTGALDHTYDEKTYSLEIVKNLAKKLKSHFEGRNIKIYCTRMTDVDLSKAARVALANKLHADLFISIHCNASEAGEHHIRGLETLYSTAPLKYGTLTSKKLAQVMLGELSKATGLEKRGVIKRNGLYILRNSKVPATIVEVGYMTNASDMAFMKSEKGHALIVKGLYQGILKALEMGQVTAGNRKK